MKEQAKSGLKAALRWILIDGFIAPLSVFFITQAVLWMLVAIYSILTDTWHFWFFMIGEGLSLLAVFIVWWKRP